MYPSSKSHAFDEAINVIGNEIKEREKGDAQHGWSRCQARDLNHRQDLWHLALASTGVEQPLNSQNEASSV